MEVVGAVASVVTIVALAKEVWTLSTDLLRDYQGAPQEVIHISNQASLILLALNLVAGSQGGRDGVNTSMTDEEARILQRSLDAAKSTLTLVCQSCQRQSPGARRTKSRLTWTLFEKKVVEGYLDQLHKTETSLGVVLQVINLRANSEARHENLRQNEEILRQLTAYHNAAQVTSSLATREWKDQQHDSLFARTDALAAFRYLQSFSIPASWKQLLNSEILFIQSENEYQKAYELYARFPLLWLWGQKAFVLTTSLRRMRGFWPNFQILNGSLNVCSIVPTDSEIVNACKRGDVIAVRDLFRAHKAWPTDVSDDDKGLLWYATESGSTELTRFLINAGAPLRSTMLHAASYYRKPQVARLLLSSGLDVEVIGDCGFTSAFFLFGYAWQKKESQVEFLNILASNSFSNFNGQDEDGWSVLHRAAAFGTAADVKRLVEMNASVHCETYNLHWTPIFCAVCYGNLETVKELWSSYRDTDLSCKSDLRGWNLLHVAVGAGRFDVVGYLLEQGVDFNAESRATSRFVPSALAEKSVTPSDVAVNCGPEAYRWWLEALQAAGHTIGSVGRQVQDIDWATETIDGLFGGCECCEEWAFS